MCVHKVSFAQPTLDQILDENLIGNVVNGSYVTPGKIDKSNGIQILHLNIQSLASKYDELLNMLDAMNDSIDVLLLCETFLKSENVIKYDIPSYSSHHIIRDNMRGGGCAILYKENLNVINRPDLSEVCEFYECVFCEILMRRRTKNVIIGEIYRRPNTPTEQFSEWYQAKLATIANENKSVVVGMDQNINLLHQHISCVNKFININTCNGLIPTIMVPTRITDTSATLIDNIVVSMDIPQVISFVIDHEISDHKACVVEIPLTIKRKCDFVHSRKFNEKSMYEIYNHLGSINWPQKLFHLDIHKKTELLIGEIQTAIEKHCPLKKLDTTCQISRPAWYDKEICDMIRKRDTLYAQRHNDVEKLSEYRKLRNLIQREVRGKKKQFFKNKLLKFNNDSNVIWGLINNVIRKTGKRCSMSNEFLINGIIESNDVIISNKFCELYRDFAKDALDKARNKGLIQSTKCMKKVERVSDSMYLHPPSELEITRIIQNLKSKTSTGYDGVSNKLLKYLYPAIKLPLIEICSESIEKGIFPNPMKHAIIKPLYKKGS